MKAKTVPVALLRRWLHYDPKTGIFTWLISPRSRTKIGDRAGGVRVRGCREITVGGARLKEHRIAYAMMTGRWPKHLVDHRDCNAQNNRWENLRHATTAENSFNRRMMKANLTGLKGVFIHRQSGLYQARIRAAGKVHYLGYFQEPADAHAAYVEAAKRLHGEFARAA